MALAQSKVTAQGQNLSPSRNSAEAWHWAGRLLEWSEEHGQIVVRRAGRISSAEIHQSVFAGEARPPRSLAEMKAGVRRLMRKRHARH